MHNRQKFCAILASVLIVSGCGGSSNGNGGAVVLPSPTPTPSPTPSPTPTPPAPVGPVYSLVGVGPLKGFVAIDINRNGSFGDGFDVVGNSGLDGKLRSNTPNLSGTYPEFPNFPIEARGFDLALGTNISVRGPGGATVVTGLTTVIAAHGFESSVRNALGVDRGPDAIRPTVSLLSFNPAENLGSSNTADAHDAARLTALNLQLTVLSRALSGSSGNLLSYSNIIADMIKDGRGGLLTDRTFLLGALRRRSGAIAGDTYDEIVADYLATYFSTMPPLIHSAAEARSWFQVYTLAVSPDIMEPYVSSRVSLPLTATEMRNLASYFNQLPPFKEATFLPLPDYYELTSHPGANYNFRADLSGCVNALRHPICNDVMNYEIYGDTTPLIRITSVQPEDPSKLAVRLNSDGTVSLERVGTASGFTYFTYTAQAPSGEIGSTRAYVRIRTFIER